MSRNPPLISSVPAVYFDVARFTLTVNILWDFYLNLDGRSLNEPIERRREIARTRALMCMLSFRVGARSYYEFAGLYDDMRPDDSGESGSQGSGKWRPYFNGQRPLSGKLKRSLFDLFSGAEALYVDGPSDLWKALWGSAEKTATACRTRYCRLGPEIDDRTWKLIRDEIECDEQERLLSDVISIFAEDISLAHQHGEPLTLRHLTEAIALYRLHWFIDDLTRSDARIERLYPCIYLCLNDRNIACELRKIDALDMVRDEMTELEVRRLAGERYRKAVGIEKHQIYAYAGDPLCVGKFV